MSVCKNMSCVRVCASEMHEQCMNKHSWGKVCKTHNLIKT